MEGEFGGSDQGIRTGFQMVYIRTAGTEVQGERCGTVDEIELVMMMTLCTLFESKKGSWWKGSKC